MFMYRFQLYIGLKRSEAFMHTVAQTLNIKFTLLISEISNLLGNIYFPKGPIN